MDWVRRDDIELLVGRGQKVPRVVVDDLGPWIGQHGVILDHELVRRLEHARLDLADDDPLDLWIPHEGPCGHTRPQADHQHAAGGPVDERRYMPEHPLDAHVQVHGRGDHLAADVELAIPRLAVGDGDRRVHPLLDVEILLDRVPPLDIAAERDEPVRRTGHRPQTDQGRDNEQPGTPRGSEPRATHRLGRVPVPVLPMLPPTPMCSDAWRRPQEQEHRGGSRHQRQRLLRALRAEARN